MSDWPAFLRIAPLVVWPGEATIHRTNSQYRAKTAQTMNDLRQELRAMDAIEPTLQLDIPPTQFRSTDGRPRLDARPRSPGVILSFARLARTRRFETQQAAKSFLMRMANAGPIGSIEGLHKAAVKATHPDLGGNEEDFKIVEEAYGVLARPNSYRFARDGFVTWHENLRAIVLTIRALRAVERYGVVQGDEQFAGFKMLTTGAAT